MKKFLLRLTLRVKMTLEKWNSVGEFRGQFPEQGSVCSSIANYISKAGENDAETFSMLYVWLGVSVGLKTWRTLVVYSSLGLDVREEKIWGCKCSTWHSGFKKGQNIIVWDQLHFIWLAKKDTWRLSEIVPETLIWNELQLANSFKNETFRVIFQTLWQGWFHFPPELAIGWENVSWHIFPLSLCYYSYDHLYVFSPFHS